MLSLLKGIAECLVVDVERGMYGLSILSAKFTGNMK